MRSEYVFMDALAGDPARVPLARGVVSETARSTFVPVAGEASAQTHLMVSMEASAFIGIVTADNSSHSHFEKCCPHVPLMSEASIALKPIERPRTSLAFMVCQAKSRISFRRPG